MDTKQSEVQQQYQDPELGSQKVARTVTDETTEKHTQTDSTDNEKTATENLYEDTANALESRVLEEVLSKCDLIALLVSLGRKEKALEIYKKVYKNFADLAPEEGSQNPQYNDTGYLMLENIEHLETSVTPNPEAPEFVPAKPQVNCDDTDITGESSNAHFDQDGH